MNINVILDLFEKLDFNDDNKIVQQLTSILKKLVSIMHYKWIAVYFIPANTNFIVQEFLFTTNDKLKSLYNFKNPHLRKTLLYKISHKLMGKKTGFRIPKTYPEYKPELHYYANKYVFKNFSLSIEVAVQNPKQIQVQLLNKFINHISKSLDHKEDEKNYIKRVNESTELIEVSKLLNSTMNLKNLLNKLFSEVKKIMKTEGCSLILIDQETGQLKFQTVKGKKSQFIKEVMIPSNKGIAGWIVRNRQPIIVNDVEKDKRFYRNVDLKSGFRTRNLIGAPLIIQDEIIGVIEAVNKKRNEFFSKTDMDVFVAMANQAAIAIQNAQYYEKLNDLFLSTVKSLSVAIEAKDKYTRGHTERVTKYSVLLAKELDMDAEMIKNVELAGLLHDIGKIGINEEILMKPGRLNNEEYSIIKQHSQIGEEIMKPIKELKEVLPGIRNHHERWDGTGYPDKLKKKNIPLLGRIITLADTYDAMTSDRPYRKGVSTKIALEEIEKCSGKQFDPELTFVFIKIIKKTRRRGLV